MDQSVESPHIDGPADVLDPPLDAVRIRVQKVLLHQIFFLKRHAELPLDLIEDHLGTQGLNELIKSAEDRRHTGVTQPELRGPGRPAGCLCQELIQVMLEPIRVTAKVGAADQKHVVFDP